MSEKSKILVTGGCGYIGSHTIVELITHGYDVVCVDNLYNADGSALNGLRQICGKDIPFYQADVCDEKALSHVFEKEKNIAAVIHFAALKSVHESVENPLLYYHNNITGLISLIAVMKEKGCNRLIFSSSCSVYGDVATLPVDEKTPRGTTQSPYAQTKSLGEDILSDYTKYTPAFRAIALRYFNPAGAHSSNLIGESPTINASNLVPVLTETAIGKRDHLTVYGNDYPTRDGTCIRDFIHVSDIANAHVLAVNYIFTSDDAENYEIFNLGTGSGSTVLEVIEAFERINQIKVPYSIGPRRLGDVIAVYADNQKAKKILGWDIRHSIEDIVKTAWDWEKRRSNKI